MPKETEYFCWIGLIEVSALMSLGASIGKIPGRIPDFLCEILGNAAGLVD